MKMAKASKADLDMAMELCNALDALTGRWSATVPDEIAKPDGDNEAEYFDRDDRDQCLRVLGYLLELADRASLMRTLRGQVLHCNIPVKHFGVRSCTATSQ